jgi:2-hydroxy-3-keto-5-methylthiopentenyl-1-phosphate phosphatase
MTIYRKINETKLKLVQNECLTSASEFARGIHSNFGLLHKNVMKQEILSFLEKIKFLHPFKKDLFSFVGKNLITFLLLTRKMIPFI